MTATTTTPLCRSIFKNGESVTTVANFTEKWIALINQIEKSKEVYCR